MKTTALILLIGLIFLGCKKDKVLPVTSPDANYYNSKGNLLILVIGDTLESAYEYCLSTIQLSNDSLPIDYFAVPDETGLYGYEYWQFLPNSDTLFWTHPNSVKFMENHIDANNLLTLQASLEYIPTQFQAIGSPTNETEDIWNVVSNLEIIKNYRGISPNSKIGIAKFVVNTFIEEWGFSVGDPKHFIFLAK